MSMRSEPFSKAVCGEALPPVCWNCQKVEAVSNSSVKKRGGMGVFVGAGVNVEVVVAGTSVGRSAAVGVDSVSGVGLPILQAAVRARNPINKRYFFMKSPFNVVRPAV